MTVVVGPGVGFGFGVVGTLALALGASTVGLVAVGLALAAAFLNAVFGFCLGCEMYLIGRRLTGARTSAVAPIRSPAAGEAAG